MKKYIQENFLAVSLAVIVFLIYLVHAFMLDGSYGGGDGIRHYLVARWSWKHPDLLLYHWGKPFFTLITSVFSQFGLIGIKIFNAIAGALTAYLCYRIALKLNYSQKLAAIVFASFAPVYMLCINSGLTEPLFAFFLVLSIYLFLSEKYITGTILLSFLPFVRSEGNMMFPLFFLVLIFRGKWFLTPLLAFGTVAYSIIGYFHYKDIFWIKTKNPYTGSNYDIYGQGELLHFVKEYDLIFGLPLTIFILAGLVWMIFRFLKKPTDIISKENLLFEEILLVYGTGLVYFVAHSVFWWKGLFGSLGLERSIAGVIPSAALIGMRGLQLFLSPVNRNKILQNILVFGIIIWIAVYPFYKKYAPLKLNEEEQLVKKAAEWYNKSEYRNEKIYYLYPYFMHKLDLDAFDGNRVGELWGLYPAIKEWGIDVVPLNTVILWDAHFGANEAYIPLDTILSDPNFKLIETFKPEQPFTTLGGYNFEIYAFLRVKPSTLIKGDELTFDFEDNKGLGNEHLISQGKASSGVRSVHVKPSDEFGVTWDKQLTDLQDFKNLARVTCEFNLYSDKPVNDLLAVMTVDEGGKSVQWEGSPLNYTEIGKWQKISIVLVLNPQYLSAANRIKIYPWNRGKNDFFIDDLKIELQNRQ